uniref:Nuclear speckle splicing regulatory protein 1 n=1 Tax=Canis lupus familiaris TaxID=9615 RepID=A0A8P0TV70_CANLF
MAIPGRQNVVLRNHKRVWAYFAKESTAVAPCFAKTISVWE